MSKIAYIGPVANIMVSLAIMVLMLIMVLMVMMVEIR